MPLLRLKPFKPEVPPKHLKAHDEVFFCELTGEAFLNYEAFYQRMILCNSLVWSCEISGKPNLTYKEALECEQGIRKALSIIPFSLKLSILYCVHHTRRSKIQDLTDEIFDYLKTHYQIDEKVEVKLKEKWYDAIVSEVPDNANISLMNKLYSEKNTSFNSPNKEKVKEFYTFFDNLKSKSPLVSKELQVVGTDLSYRVLFAKGPKKGEVAVVKGKHIRRSKKGIFFKDKVKLFIKQSCRRTTTSTEDGYWVVEEKDIQKFGLGKSSIQQSSFFTPIKHKKNKSYAEQVKDLSLEQKKVEEKQERDKKRMKEKRDEKALREQKLKEKEEEKARKKDEREKERDLKTFELDFFREFNKPREDLHLEDSKPLNPLSPFETTLDQELIGDTIMVVEFVNTFGSLFDLDQEIDAKITFNWMEEALTEHDAEGNYFTILKFLLHSYLRIDREEINYENDDEGASASDDDTTQQPQKVPDGFFATVKKASANARAAAAWPMLHQGMSLSDITIEPFTLTEVLRLHILSSGFNIGGMDYNQWQRRGQHQLSDDPCVSFRHQEKDTMRKLMTSSVYDLHPKDKLKILVLICDQCLMLSTIKDFMEDSFEQIKTLRKELRQVQFEENKRKKNVAQEKWKKKLAERNKLKEEKERQKERKLQGESPSGAPTPNNTSPKGVTSNSKETSVDDEKKNSDEVSCSKDEEERLEREQQERKRKKEEKENQIEEFHHEKFLFREREILKEIAKYSHAISVAPLGTDRLFRRYWKFGHVDGLLVENNDEHMLSIAEILDADSGNQRDEEIVDEKGSNPKGTIRNILHAKDSGKPLTNLILNRYQWENQERYENFISKIPSMNAAFEKIENGDDPRLHIGSVGNMWCNVTSNEQFEDIFKSLNLRGIRERVLHSGMSNGKSQILDSLEEAAKAANKKLKNINVKKQDSDEIDKNLFETMDDYIEGNLRDHLLELEERLWVASIGGAKCHDRLKWRGDIEEGMVKLIKNPNTRMNGENLPEEYMDIKLNTTPEGHPPTANGTVNKTDFPSSVPSHLNAHSTDDSSRCSTPVNVPDGEKQMAVQELAAALLMIQEGIESRFLKPPLGETDEIKREKMKEMLDAGKGDSEVKDEDEKKSSTCLSRWKESIMKCTSFSQIFIHLDTLDRSILWNKSIQNTKCRLCKRKGNEEEMLLCDGCDRGFHMCCLKPPLKSVPDGDWFCHDCRPIEIRRRNRRSSFREETEEEEEEEEDGGTSEEESENDDYETNSQSDSQSDIEEEYEDADDEDDDGSEILSEHGEHCTVCNEEGNLILCDECPRSYHINCCYPQLKKVPRGSWCCQICSGADLELTYKRRAITQERRRARNMLKAEEEQNEGKKQQRPQSASKSGRLQTNKKRSSPLLDNRAPKKARYITDSNESLRTSGFNRHQLKNCSTLISEIFEREEAEEFLCPVDPEEVPDYCDFIDRPMDFGTIKRKLNTAKYLDIENFLDDVNLVFSNCETYNPPKSRITKDCAKLKSFVTKKVKSLSLG